MLLSNDLRDVEYDYKINLDKLSAPLKSGEVIGKLKLTYNNDKVEYNIIVNEDVKKANFFETLYSYFKDIVSGNINLIKN